MCAAREEEETEGGGQKGQKNMEENGNAWLRNLNPSENANRKNESARQDFEFF